MARMTRTESRVRTREQVIAAAAEVFTQKGFHGASLEEIAEAAGYSRGAVYSNFNDKTELFLAVRDERMHRRTQQVGELLTEATTPHDFFESLRKLNKREPRENVKKWYMLNLELWLFAMRNPDVRPRLAERQSANRAALTRAIEALYTSLDARLPIPADKLAIIVEAIDLGLPYQEFLDPTAVPSEFIIQALEFILDAGVALGQATSSRAKRRVAKSS